MYFTNNNRSTWKSRIGREIATWFLMPSVVIGFHFEVELGQYFEEVYAWYNRTGSHNLWSGFRMMKLHNLYFDWELPWWNQANSHPRLMIPTTMEYLETNFSGDDYAIRFNLIKRGLRKGQD